MGEEARRWTKAACRGSTGFIGLQYYDEGVEFSFDAHHSLFGGRCYLSPFYRILIFHDIHTQVAGLSNLSVSSFSDSK